MSALTILDSPAFFGQVGTSGTGWATDERPKSYREKILQLSPNGWAQITGLSSKLKNERVDDPEFSWWEKTVPKQAGSVTDCYDDATFASATASATSSGVQRHLKLSSDVARHFRKGSTLAVMSGYDMGSQVFGKVTDVVLNDASSRVSFDLIGADSGNILSNSSLYVAAAGNVNPEGSFIPDVIGYKGEKKNNYTQIFRNPYQLTRTAAQTKLRTRDPYTSLRQEQLMLHGIDIERAFIFGKKNEDTSTITGEPERTTGGIIEFVPSSNKRNFYTDADAAYDGTSWDDTGIDWIEEGMEQMFQYGSMERMAYCGSGALRGLNKLARLHGHINIQTGATSFGLKVTRWETPYGVIYFKMHPIFNQTEASRYSALFISPENLVTRVMKDTDLKTDDGQGKAGLQAYDGKKEEYIAELGLELHHPMTFALWSGVGINHQNYVA